MTDVATPAGWYPSPTDPATKQYWDGQRWTEQTQPAATTQAPPEPPPAGGSPLWKRKIMWPVYGLIGLVVVGAIAGGDTSEQSPESPPVSVLSAVTDNEGTATTGPEPVQDTVVDEPESAAATRDGPWPLGRSIEVTAEAMGDADGSVWSLAVTGPVRDVTPAATTQGLAADPLEGNVIAAVPFEMTLIEAGKEPLAPLFNVDVEFFSPEMLGVAETLLACGVWNEAFSSNREVFVGGTISGLLCAEVPIADLEGGLLITADEEGDRVFLATE